MLGIFRNPWDFVVSLNIIFMNIGIDIVEVERIAKLIKNKRFLNRIFSENEIKYCCNKKNPVQHYAVRFAAKEAVWKALGNRKLTHKNISVVNKSNGKPEVYILSKPQKKIAISLSHTKQFAIAVAVVR